MLRLSQLVQAVGYTVQVNTAPRQSLADRLFDQGRWVGLMQSKDRDELAYSPPFRPLLYEVVKGALVAGRPFFTPAPQRFGMFKSAGTLFE